MQLSHHRHLLYLTVAALTLLHFHLTNSTPSPNIITLHFYLLQSPPYKLNSNFSTVAALTLL
ncbi:hypothetical protein Patl1_29539 [Pistacia atlantica]|uniref:Uncharacterized protein n=1 Tax=Pistacia atlantica TaxID=434234 RepID=A0ACC1ADK7_9ROSI|nr:hypothetical protein Patl1_29539 [Pistacia atlantica]